jgi:hypothetical protein
MANQKTNAKFNPTMTAASVHDQAGTSSGILSNDYNEKGGPAADNRSLLSTATSFELSTVLLPDPAFAPGRVFNIRSQGLRKMRLPGSDPEMQIDILSMLSLCLE